MDQGKEWKRKKSNSARALTENEQRVTRNSIAGVDKERGGILHFYITLLTSLSVTTLSSCGVDWAMATCPPELYTTAHWSKQFSSCSQERRLPFTKKIVPILMEVHKHFVEDK